MCNECEGPASASLELVFCISEKPKENLGMGIQGACRSGCAADKEVKWSSTRAGFCFDQPEQASSRVYRKDFLSGQLAEDDQAA